MMILLMSYSMNTTAMTYQGHVSVVQLIQTTNTDAVQLNERTVHN